MCLSLQGDVIYTNYAPDHMEMNAVYQNFESNANEDSVYQNM